MKYSFNEDDVDMLDGVDIMSIINESVFSFAIDESVHCCGVKEIGNISSSIVTRSKAFEKTLCDAVAKMHNASKGKYSREIKLMANLNQSRRCNILKKAFVTTGLFKKHLEFKNRNSGNIVEVWFSI